MMLQARKDIAVAIPARNEEQRIGSCLSALAGQCSERTTVVVVINNSTDRSIAVARHVADRKCIDLRIVHCVIEQDLGVGAVRNIGCLHAIRHMPDLRYLLGTDADCVVGPGWVFRNSAHLETSDAVCGRVTPLIGDLAVLQKMNQTLARNEGVYRGLVQTLYACYAEGCQSLGGTHGETAGASLAITKEAYLAIEGFTSVGAGEDRMIVRKLHRLGYRVRHANDVVVQASCRLVGRARGGMSDALKARIFHDDYYIDDCLPSSECLLKQVAAGTLGSWPPLAPQDDRVLASDLGRHIDALATYLNSHRPGLSAGTTVPAQPAPDCPADALACIPDYKITRADDLLPWKAC